MDDGETKGGGRRRGRAAKDRSGAEPHRGGPAGGNRLLAAVPAEELDRLRPELEEVDLAFKQELYGPDRPVRHAYFPHRGVCSVVEDLEDGAAVEVATVGHEGFVGVSLLLGGGAMAGRCFVQVPGTATRIRAAAFPEAMRACPGLHRLLLRYTQALLSQVARSAACNRAHSIEERCARWMLMTHDRVDGDESFPLTQEFLAQMLGVRRSGVTVAAGMLQKAGLIRYSRGLVRVVDREGLQAASCPCYDAVRAEFDRLLG